MDSCSCVENSPSCCCGGHSHREFKDNCDSCCGHGPLSYRQHEHYQSTQDVDKDYYEQQYHQLALDKEKMERNFEKERRERQSTEEKFQRESKERILYEERLSELNGKLGRYDNDLNMLRNENGFLKSQFDSLRNVINSRVNVESTSFALPHAPVSQSESCLLVGEDTESYRHEISVLAKENELFKQIVDIINSQGNETTVQEASDKYIFESNWQTDAEKTRLQDENSKLKSQVRELQKGQRDLQSQIEETESDLQDKTRKMKNDISHLDEKFHSKTIYCQELERQLFQISSEYQEEMQKMEIKVESEVLKKSQIQEELTALENTVHRLELERIEMVAQLDELYNSENKIIVARAELEARFTSEINELQVRLEEEMRSKIELSQEMTLLMNEFADLRTRSNQMEEMYANEIQALQINLSAAISGGNSTMTTQQTNNNAAIGQRLPQGSGTGITGNELQSQLSSEIEKRETLERENKDLLYKMKNILSNTDSNADGMNELQLSHCSSSGDNSLQSRDNESALRKKIRSLQNKVEELTDECESLRRSSKKRKEAENKNRELIDELEEMNSERDSMLKKQKALVKEVDNSSCSLQDLSDKNRKLINEIDTASRKIRDMEDTFRQDRNALICSFDREKSLEMNNYKRKMEDLEDQMRDQKRENQMLEDKIRKLEDEIDHQRNINKRSTKDSFRSNDVKPNSSYGSSAASNANDLKKNVEELEEMLKEKENKHLIDLEGQNKQLRDEFEKEKRELKQIFEEEKRALFGNVHLPSLPVNSSTHQSHPSSVSGSANPQTQQLGLQRPLDIQNSGIAQQAFPSPQDQYAASTTTQGYGFPVVQQGNGPPFQGSQQTQSSVNPYHQNGVFNNQNPVYPPAAFSSNNQITQLNETINKLQQEVNRLTIDNQNMGKRMKDLQGQMTRKSDCSVKARNDNKQPGVRPVERQSRVHFEVDQSASDGLNGNDSFRIDSSDIYLSGNSDDILDDKLQDTMKKLVHEHREHSDELRKQIKLQKDSFEREKLSLMSENQKLCASLKCLKKEIHVFKHEKENLLQKLQRQRRESVRLEERMKEDIVSIKNEYESKLKQDSKRSNEIVHELQHKIKIYEAKLKEIELKFRDELTLLENRYAQERNQLEIQIRETDNQVRSKLESHYQAKLKTEKEKYERTLKELRREIQCLQDQRKEIQLRLYQDASAGGRVTIQNESFVSYSKNHEYYKRLQSEFENRYAQEKRSFEDTIRDLKKEVNELEKEKSDIKASYKEERTEMEERFQREKRRLEERHKRDMDELKRSLDLFQIHDQAFIPMSGIANKEVLRPQQTAFQGKNTSLEIKNDLLENDIAFLKGRVRDLESRQTKMLSSSANKSLGMEDRKVRFDLDRSSIPRSLSYTDLRSIHNSEHGVSQDRRSLIKGLSRDDLEISRGRIGANGLNYQIGQNFRNMKSYQDIASGNKGVFYPENECSTFGISRMSSTSTLNEGVGLVGAGKRSSLPGGMSGHGVYQNSAVRSGFSGSSGFQSGNGMGLGSAVMAGMCGSSYAPNRLGVGGSVLTGLNRGGLMAGHSNRMGSSVAAVHNGGTSSGFLSGNGTRLGCGLSVLGGGELNSGFVNQTQAGIGSSMASLGGGSLSSLGISGSGVLMGSNLMGPGGGGLGTMTGNTVGLMDSRIRGNENTANMSGFQSVVNPGCEINGNLAYGNPSFSTQSNVVRMSSGNGNSINSIATSSQVIDPTDS